MRRPFRSVPGLLVSLAVAISLSHVLAQDSAAAYPDPIVLTAAGQSADANLVQAALGRVDIQAEIRNQLQADALDDVGTLVLVMGGSQKGLGAAGVDVDGELERVNALVARAAEEGVPMLGIHVGGEARRGPLSEPFIEAVASHVPDLIVVESGNRDGYFDDIAAASDAELHLIDNALGVGDAFTALRNESP